VIYIFKRSGLSWVQQAILSGSDGASNDGLGHSVAISGDYIIGGAFNKTVGTAFSQGQAYIFFRNANTWSQQAILTASDGTITDEFGYTVNISGDNAIITSLYKKIGANDNTGGVYIFSRNGSTWSQQAMLAPSDGAASDYFGYGLGISGNDIFIGAYNKIIGANNYQGRIYFFKN
jgi:hypothetical protein